VIERFMESPRRRTALQVGADGAAWVLSIVAAAPLRYDIDVSRTEPPATTLCTPDVRLSASMASLVHGGS